MLIFVIVVFVLDLVSFPGEHPGIMTGIPIIDVDIGTTQEKMTLIIPLIEFFPDDPCCLNGCGPT